MSPKTSPFFSIITATYNAEKTLPQLLQSLAEQTCQDFIWICQDALSSDSTLQIAENYRNLLAQVDISSEKDHGIYDAWNKAIARQKEHLGQWVLFLGADDVLVNPHVLQKVYDFCSTLPEHVQFTFGQLQMINVDGSKDPIITPHIENAFTLLPIAMQLPHPAVFARKELFTQHVFDTSFRIVGDWEWTQRAWQKKEQACVLTTLVTYMAKGGISESLENAYLLQQERCRILALFRPKTFKQKLNYAFIYSDAKFYPCKIWLKTVLNKNKYSLLLLKKLQKLRMLLLRKSI